MSVNSKGDTGTLSYFFIFRSSGIHKLSVFESFSISDEGILGVKLGQLQHARDPDAGRNLWLLHPHLYNFYINDNR